MYREEKKHNVFGFMLTIPDLSLYLAAIAALIAGIVGIVLAEPEFLLGGVLFVLLSFIWHYLGTSDRIQMALEEGKVELIRDPDAIYRRGMDTLARADTEGRWECVRIYAPIGLCDPSEWKDRWLASLKDGLGTTNRVNHFSGVYALPQDGTQFFALGERRLQVFESTPRTVIHYLPPDDKDHPLAAAGLGAIIFSDPDHGRYEIILAFLGHVTGGAMERSGFVIQDKQVGRMVAEWFDTHILRDSSQQYVLRGLDPTDNRRQVDFATALAKIERDYYPQQHAAA